jgi:hypothetical protein
LSLDNAIAQQQQPQQTRQGLPLVIIPAVIRNILAVVSFLIGTSSFILGLRIQSAAKTPIVSKLSSFTMHKYFELLILALVMPSIVGLRFKTYCSAEQISGQS